MCYNILFLIFALTALPGLVAPAANSSVSQQHAGGTAVIDWPVTGEHIQGAVVIRGSTPASGMRSYQLAYALSSDPNQAWILIQEGTTPIQDGILAVWDTTSIPDGSYNLRLLVNQSNGDQTVTNMYNLLVENQGAVESLGITPTAWYTNLATPRVTAAPSSVALLGGADAPTMPTPSPLPQNPVEISSSNAITSFGVGAALSLSAFLLFGVYWGVRHFLNGRK
jgi:hypothetical protein